MDSYTRLACHVLRCDDALWDGYIEKLAALGIDFNRLITQQTALLPTNLQNGMATPTTMSMPIQPGSPTKLTNSLKPTLSITPGLNKKSSDDLISEMAKIESEAFEDNDEGAVDYRSGVLSKDK